ncbi:hypothetical protein [Mucilaginibacter arboris]|nr:hypothetical protein [Mucilaginibacter arboris]
MRFDIKSIQPYRGLILFPFVTFGLLLISLEINKWVPNAAFTVILILSLLALTFGLFYYFIYSQFSIIVDNEKFKIEWIRKLPFNFVKTETIHFKDIKKIRIDRQLNSNQRSVKIYFDTPTTNNQTNSFYINSYDNKFFRGDILNLIDYLDDLCKEKSIRVTTHWEEWNEKGYTKLVTRIIIIGLSTMAIYLILKTANII